MVRRVRDILGEDIKWQTLATAGSGADTTIDVTDGTDWNEGSILEWEADGDQAYVQSVAANVLTVIRSVNGTTGASHAATAATKDPLYPFIKVSDAIDATIQTLWPWAWKTTEVSISPLTTKIYYDLANEAIDLVRAFQEDGSTPPVAQYFGSKGSLKPIALNRNANSLTGVTTDVAVSFPNSTFSTSTVYVQYRSLITDTVATGSYSDLTEGAVTEAVCWGAAARLVKTQSAARMRNDARQWNSSVDLQQVNETADFYYAEFRRLLMDAHDNLMRTNPPMRVWQR